MKKGGGVVSGRLACCCYTAVGVVPELELELGTGQCPILDGVSSKIIAYA